MKRRWWQAPAVVGGSVLAGWAIGSVLAAQGLPDQSNQGRGGQPRAAEGLLASVPFHRTLVAEVSSPAPGRLVAVATFRVHVANPKEAAREPFRVVVTVTDPGGKVVVDREPVGEGVDEPGKGAWEQDFTFTRDGLPAGPYAVELLALAPGKIFTHPDGRKEPHFLGYCRRPARVR